MQSATVRFGDRVAGHLRSRPGYPAALIDVLVRHCGFGHSSVVADVGAGTGLLTRLFAEAGNPVFAVEPNRETRAALESVAPRSSTFTSVDGRAEATTLPVRRSTSSPPPRHSTGSTGPWRARSLRASSNPVVGWH